MLGGAAVPGADDQSRSPGVYSVTDQLLLTRVGRREILILDLDLDLDLDLA
jgi:hypothetical protein